MVWRYAPRQTDSEALDLAVKQIVMMLFKIIDINVVEGCQELFGFEPPSVILARHMKF